MLYIQEAVNFIDYDGNGNVIFDSREVPPLQSPLTMCKDAEAPHSVVNLSKTILIRLVRGRDEKLIIAAINTNQNQGMIFKTPPN